MERLSQPPSRLEVVLVEHPPDGPPVVLGRSTDPDLVHATGAFLEEQARRAVVFLRWRQGDAA